MYKLEDKEFPTKWTDTCLVFKNKMFQTKSGRRLHRLRVDCPEILLVDM